MRPFALDLAEARAEREAAAWCEARAAGSIPPEEDLARALQACRREDRRARRRAKREARQAVARALPSAP